MERTFDDQCANIDRVTEDAKTVGVSGLLLTKIEDFLEDYYGMNKVYPFTFQRVKGWPGVRWDIPTGYCSVLFSPDDDTWTVNAKFTKSTEDRYHSGMKTTYSYIGKPSFYITQQDNTEKPFYVLPGKICKDITLPDNFSKEYSPLIPERQVCVLWETNRYDGLISGYVMYKSELCYVNMVEETPFERNRIFALHKLSYLEKKIALLKRLEWKLVLSNSLFWKIHIWIFNRKIKKTYGIQLEKTDNEILGYVVNL